MQRNIYFAAVWSRPAQVCENPRSPGRRRRVSALLRDAVLFSGTGGWLISSVPLPREAQLLLLCAHRELNESLRGRLAELLSVPLRWPYVLRLASLYGLRPCLWRHLHDLPETLLPAPARDLLREISTHNRTRQQFQCAEVVRLSRVLEHAGVQATAYRQSALALTLGAPLHLREFDRMDLLVAPEDAARAARVLAGEGYLPSPGISSSAPEPELDGAAFLVNRESIAMLELHWGDACGARLPAFSLQRILAHARQVTVAGAAVRVPRAENLVHLCCREGARYVWRDLGIVCDLAELFASRQVTDLTFVLAADWAPRCRNAVWFGLELARELFNEPPPAMCAEAALPAQPLWMRRMFAVTAARLFAEQPVPAGATENLRFQWHMRDTLAGRLRYLLGYALTPNQADWDILRLPRSLRFLYPALRVARLAGRAAALPFANLLPRSLPRRRALGSFTPTPLDVVQRMLELAQVGPADVVYDLGCGDGRVVIEAAKQYGARGVGVDEDSARIRQAEADARAAGVQDRVAFLERDALTVSLAEATVVMLYVSAAAADALRSRCQRELREGARVVAHGADVGLWDRSEVVVSSGVPTTIYLWKIQKAGLRG